MAISVLVVDDSVVIRRLVATVLDEDPDIVVAGVAANGRIGLEKIKQLKPDLVTLDIEMPVMDGLSTLREIRKLYPRLPVIMFSTLSDKGAAITLEALALGADDYVCKPANVGSITASLDSVRTQLTPKIKALCTAKRSPLLPAARTATATSSHRAPALARQTSPTLPPKVLLVGCSTGGPEALTGVLRALPATFPLPIVVVQHMPPVFTAMFAQRLDKQCALRAREAAAGDALEPGLVLIAPGDFHMTLRRVGARTEIKLDQGPPVNYCRPAVDNLFMSAADVYGGAALAVVLTGMGHDGRTGAEALRGHGVPVLVQDEATSVVWGMPGAIANAGLATAVLPLTSIAGQVMAGIPTRPAPAGVPTMTTTSVS